MIRTPRERWLGSQRKMQLHEAGTVPDFEVPDRHGDPHFIRRKRAVYYLLDPQILLAVTNRSEHEVHLW